MFERALEALRNDRRTIQTALSRIDTAIAALSKNGTKASSKAVKGTKAASAGGTKDAVYLILEAHPKGITVAEIGAQLQASGTTVTKHTVHNALRNIHNVVAEVGTNGVAKLYKLKRGKHT